MRRRPLPTAGLQPSAGGTLPLLLAPSAPPNPFTTAAPASPGCATTRSSAATPSPSPQLQSTHPAPPPSLPAATQAPAASLASRRASAGKGPTLLPHAPSFYLGETPSRPKTLRWMDSDSDCDSSDSPPPPSSKLDASLLELSDMDDEHQLGRS
ncbi:classical arabinogalactan protein 4-like [Miscanthus floridulus]|uniref:classical arabinogalactan protein 4-like n=1 Tax=Miscanthus floridulus TaxID=154761 RepID=UPI00345832F2